MENSSTEQGCSSTQQGDKNPSKNDNSSGSSSSIPVNVDHQEGGESTAVMTTNEINSNNQSNRSRTPFTHLSQVDADLALARTLQDQERAYMMLRMNGGDGSDYGSWEGGSYVHEDDDEFDDDPSEEEFEGSDAAADDDDDDDDDEEEEDAFDVHAHAESEDDDNPRVELDSTAFSSDEAYARALQDAEDQEMAARLLALAGINDMVAEEVDDSEDHGANSQDTWEDVDPDELSYEELIALGEVVGTESRGLSADSIASLPSINYKAPNIQDGSSDTCVICRLDYEDGETLTVLSCKHLYHSECITNWLQINKVCPVCSAEVSTSGNS